MSATEYGISFNKEMVEAILAGKKTQTRRRILEQPEGEGPLEPAFAPGMGSITGVYGFRPLPGAEVVQFKSPVGGRGSRLWVREVFGVWPSGEIIYRASSDYTVKPGDNFNGWHPPLHMDRVQSRIDLEVESVHLERLHDMSAEDAIAEGALAGVRHLDRSGANDEHLARSEFKKIWNALYSNWDENEWVWVIKFKVVKP